MDTVSFYTNLQMKSLSNQYRKNYQLISTDSIEITVIFQSITDKYRLPYHFYSDTELHILSFCANGIDMGIDSVILIKVK